MSVQQGWRKVSEWGQPTAETCPWGLRDKGGNLWVVTELEECGGLMPQIEWQPLPPPVDEVLPPPEPEGRWAATCDGDTHYVAVWAHQDAATNDECQRAAAILNAVDAGETVGRVRPWQEAPDEDTTVLMWAHGVWADATGVWVRACRSPWMAQPAPPEEVEG